MAKVRLDGPQAATRLAQSFSEEFNFISVLGPLADGTIVAVEDVRGLYVYTEPTSATLVGERLTPRTVYTKGAAFSDERVAVGAYGIGAFVYEVATPDGRPRLIRIDDPRIEKPNDVAWVGPRRLAVADQRRGIHLYDIREDGTWTRRAFWYPEDEEPIRLLGMDALPDGRLAVSTRLQRVLLLDTSPLDGIGENSGWLLR